MDCIYCGEKAQRVCERLEYGRTWRRYECRVCKKRFSTVEMTAERAAELEKKPKAAEKKDTPPKSLRQRYRMHTLCWDCALIGKRKCEWDKSKGKTPVHGCLYDKNAAGYRIVFCPEFEPDAHLKRWERV